MSRAYFCDFVDLSVAVYRVIARRYGEASLSGARQWPGLWIRKNPLEITSVNTGPAEKAYGLQGNFCLRGQLQGKFYVGIGEEGCMVQGVVKESMRSEAELFLDEVQKQLNTESIYRGKAFTVGREFLDLDGISKEEIVLSAKTQALLTSQVWTIIENPKFCSEMNIHQQRRILFSGPFGSGKTFAALITGRKAVANGWTVIYVPPTCGQVETLLAFSIAKKYPPAVLLMEDIDYEQRVGGTSVFRRLLAEIDGLLSKGTKVMVIMTTNFKDQISGAMLRPGRIDQIIDFGDFGEEEIRRLISAHIPARHISPDIDWARVGEACHSYPPAFIKEVAKSAALQSAGTETPMVDTAMLTDAAENLRYQFGKCNEAIRTGQYL